MSEGLRLIFIGRTSLAYLRRFPKQMASRRRRSETLRALIYIFLLCKSSAAWPLNCARATRSISLCSCGHSRQRAVREAGCDDRSRHWKYAVVFFETFAMEPTQWQTGSKPQKQEKVDPIAKDRLHLVPMLPQFPLDYQVWRTYEEIGFHCLICSRPGNLDCSEAGCLE